MSFEIVGARDTVLKLIAMHRRTIARIESGEHFHNNGRDVTRAVRDAAYKEITQCTGVLEALENMNLGNIQRANELLSQIKEFIPHGDS